MKCENKLAKIINAADYAELNIEDVKNLISTGDELIRCDVIEKLYDFANEDEIQKIIYTLVDDESELVRCSVYECIGNIHSGKSTDVLLDAMIMENDEYAHTYLLAALSELAQYLTYEDITAISRYYDHNFLLSKRVRISYLYFLYVVYDDVEKIYDILEYLSDDDYHIRFVVLNTLIACENHKDLLLERYKIRLEEETSQAVIELLNDEISRLCL